MTVKVIGVLSEPRSFGTEMVTCKNCSNILEFLESDKIFGTNDGQIDFDVSWINCPTCKSRVYNIRN